MTCTTLLSFGRDTKKPGDERLRRVDQRQPLREIPIVITQRGAVEAGLPAEDDDNRVSLGGDKAEQKNVATSTIVAFEHCLAERRVLVETNFFMLCANEVVHNMRACRARL